MLRGRKIFSIRGRKCELKYYLLNLKQKKYQTIKLPTALSSLTNLEGKDWFLRIAFLFLHNMTKALSGFDYFPLEMVGLKGKNTKKMPTSTRPKTTNNDRKKMMNQKSVWTKNNAIRSKLCKWPTEYETAYWYHSVNVINLSLSRSDHIRRLPL